MILGYAYPAYECYKTVEKNKPEIEQLRFWCQYWILVAVMSVLERFSDAFISWLPMYSEAKLAFIIYLWYPRTKGTTYVYDSFFKPYVAKHETEIDRNLLELRVRAGDMTYTYCQKVVSYGQTRIFEILQYVAAQSTPRPRATQPQEPAPRTRQSPVTAAASATVAAASATVAAAVTAATAPRQPSTKPQASTQPQDEEPISPTTSSSSQDLEMEEELSSVKEPSTSASASAPVPAPAPNPTTTTTSQATSPLKKSVSMPPAPESPSKSATNNADAKRIEPAPTKVIRSPARPSGVKSLPGPEETVMEDAIRVTRGRLRKTRSTITK